MPPWMAGPSWPCQTGWLPSRGRQVTSSWPPSDVPRPSFPRKFLGRSWVSVTEPWERISHGRMESTMSPWTLDPVGSIMGRCTWLHALTALSPETSWVSTISPVMASWSLSPGLNCPSPEDHWLRQLVLTRTRNCADRRNGQNDRLLSTPQLIDIRQKQIRAGLLQWKVSRQQSAVQSFMIRAYHGLQPLQKSVGDEKRCLTFHDSYSKSLLTKRQHQSMTAAQCLMVAEPKGQAAGASSGFLTYPLRQLRKQFRHSVASDYCLRCS